jgi:hypothetical protein
VWYTASELADKEVPLELREVTSKMSRLIPLTTLSLILACLPSAAAIASNADSLFAGDFKYKIETDTTVYVIGDTVTIAFTVTYIGAEPESVLFGCFTTHSVAWVYDSTNTVWGSGCYHLVHWHFMQPGESLVDYHLWNTWNTPPWNYPLGFYGIAGEARIVYEPAYDVSVVVELVAPSTGIHNPAEPTTWSTVKSLFR